MKAVARARHETCNKRMKEWGCLNRVWRHCKLKHPFAFYAILNITQLTFENGSPLFPVRYDDNGTF